MRVVVVGAGALGGFYGGVLARAEADVTFLARGQTLAGLQTNGLEIRSKLAGDFTMPVAVTGDPTSLGPADLVFLSVKTYDLEDAARFAAPLVGPQTTVLAVQNGVDHVQRLEAILGEGRAIPGVVLVSATVDAPGSVRQIGGPGLVQIGEAAGPVSERVERIARLFADAGISVRTHDDMPSQLWRKFMIICAMSGVSALTGLTLRQIFNDLETGALYYDVMAEVVEVARAQQIDLPASAPDDVMDMLLNDPAPPERGSMAYDLMTGRRLELETLNGAVVRLGRQSGVAVPCNRVIYAALRPYATGRLSDASP